jgi:structural toxin protein (hemagglutinin/hemolysin) RtxA
LLKLIVFIPLTHKEEVKAHLFSAGAGKQGAYDSCCFETYGYGQFRPLKNSKPYLGEMGKIEYVKEARVEFLCSPDKIKPIILALRKFHPYEEPAFDVIKLEVFDE